MLQLACAENKSQIRWSQVGWGGVDAKQTETRRRCRRLEEFKAALCRFSALKSSIQSHFYIFFSTSIYIILFSIRSVSGLLHILCHKTTTLDFLATQNINYRLNLEEFDRILPEECPPKSSTQPPTFKKALLPD